ncbi:MAG: hypothetical protein ACYC6L_10460 [Anaerolineae bacterium]
MPEDKLVYGNIDSRTDLENVFRMIRKDAAEAKSRAALTELYKRAGYLITLTRAPSWEEKFGKEVGELRRVGEQEFTTTAKAINRRAGEIGTAADYDETWGQ